MVTSIGNNGFPVNQKFRQYHGPPTSTATPAAVNHERQRHSPRHGPSIASSRIGTLSSAVYFVASSSPSATPSRTVAKRSTARGGVIASSAMRKNAATNRSSLPIIDANSSGRASTPAAAISAAV